MASGGDDPTATKCLKDTTPKVANNCEPCENSNKRTEATRYCKECDEYLCDKCVQTHKTIKATRQHLPITIQEKEKENVVACEPCESAGETTVAVNFCEICQECLCNECTATHKSMKATKNHMPVAITQRNKNEDKRDDITYNCDPCSNEGKKTYATQFCELCDEFLCDNCTLVHTRIKATNSHVPVPVSSVKNFIKTMETGRPHLDKCEQCEDITKKAINFCHDCNEKLCSNCSRSHGLLKVTMSHKQTPLADIEFIKLLCELCENEQKSNEAVRKCNECDQLLCFKCVKLHSIMKVTKNHTLVQVGAKVASTELKLCHVCEAQGSRCKSTKYCEQCDEYYCKKCSIIHEIGKMTKSHILIDAADAATKKSAKSAPKCEPCNNQNMLNDGNFYCTICEEHLCKKCMNMHKNLRQTKQHKIIEEAKRQEICGLCKISDNHDNPADLYCNDCCEFLCKDCCKKHKSTKAFKNHALLPAEGQTKEDDTPRLLCEPCKQQGDNKTASGFCQECENELLCQECIKQHKALKQTRNHGLCIDLTNYEKFDKDSDEEKQKPKDRTTMNKENQKQSKKNITPGQPRASNVGADFLTLSWDKPSAFKDDDFYQVSYRDVDKSGKWKMHPGEFYTTTVDLTDLKSNTQFVFRVRAMCNNEEGPYSEISEAVFTTTSPAARLVGFSKIGEEGKPSPTKHILPITEIRNARNTKAKTRKFDAGPAPIGNCKEKTIMLVGATGSGKSTLVDGIANYALGVNWDDPFRFTIINLEDEEKQNQHSQAVSQTEWITCYSINPEQGSRLPYRLNIIDTPGFGDTRGLERDQKIVEQIRQLFTETPPMGVSFIDAVCFLIKAPDARLTAVQNYIFQSVMSLFGKDIEKNICSLITFADGKDPPVMAALLESGLPFGKYFTFNNSGLFAKNVQSSSLSPLFWSMGLTSFRDFFDHLERNMETKSLQLTKDVLDERFRLETTVKNLQPQLDRGLLKAYEMQQEIKIIEENKSLIKDNKDFEYEVTETHQKQKELAPGLHVTNCSYCHFTCHENCGIPNDGDKSRCIAMKNGICTVCPNNCEWQKHANTPFVWEYVPVKVKKTYAEMEKKYQEASGNLLTQEQVVEKMGEELADLSDNIEDLMIIVKECNERLSEIALRPNPLTMIEHIDLMIVSETLEKKDGFIQRIATLNGFRQRAQIISTAENFNKVAQNTLGAVGKKKRRERDAQSVWKRLGAWWRKK